MTKEGNPQLFFALSPNQPNTTQLTEKYFILGILYNLANMTLFNALELKMRKRKFKRGGGGQKLFLMP